MTVVEICLDDVEGAALVEAAGADRIELCSDLTCGGLTPSIGSIARTLATVRRVGVQVLVRPRPGNFVYSEEEVEVMLADISAVRALTPSPGVRVGFVVGALTGDGKIDVRTLERLVETSGDAPTTAHRAFDTLADPLGALETLVDLGVDRVLTSGGAMTAIEGAPVLQRLVETAAGRITVLAAGSVRPGNVAEVVRRTGVGEVHLRAGVPAARRAASVTSVSYDTDQRTVTDGSIVEEIVRALAAGRAHPVRDAG